MAFQLGALLVGASAAAHPLEEGTARVSLRDDHVEVLVDWDVFRLVDAAPTAVATSDDAALMETHARLRRRVESETTLHVDGAQVSLRATGFPTPEALRAMAATLSASGQDHGARARMRLEAQRAVPGARRVGLSAPRALGPVVISFVQPATWYAQPGERASFDVLGRAHTPPTTIATVAPTPAPKGAWFVAGLSVACALAVTVTGRRRAEVSA